MQTLLWKICFNLRSLALQEDEGQDLVEYALVIALVSIGAVAGLHTLAGKITGVFSTIGTSL
jgi:pilus assembly protein Flp/PilA